MLDLDIDAKRPHFVVHNSPDDLPISKYIDARGASALR